MREEFAEKRRYPRLDFRIPMRYRKIATNARELKGSLMKNISEGGVRMTIYEFLPLNSKLATEIPLMSGRRPVEGACRVAWVVKAAFSEQYEVGVEFVNLNQGDQTQIAEFIFKEGVEKLI